RGARRVVSVHDRDGRSRVSAESLLARSDHSGEAQALSRGSGAGVRGGGPHGRGARHGAPPRLARDDPLRRDLLHAREARCGRRHDEPAHLRGDARRDARGVPEDPERASALLGRRHRRGQEGLGYGSDLTVVPRRRVRLVRPSPRHEAAFLAAVRRSRRLHGAFVEPPCTSEEYACYLRRQRRPNQVSFLVLDAETDELAGVVNINEIVRDSRDSASLGYYAFEPFAGKGLMREALARVVAIAFTALELHRLEATIQPSNVRSIRLVESLGFKLEGTARRFLKIRGRWRDHERWSLLAEEWRLATRARRSERTRQVHARSTARTATVSTSKPPAADRRPSVNAASRPRSASGPTSSSDGT